METILGIILVLMLLVGGACLCFLMFVQPIWSVVDVAVSKHLSGGTKAAVLLLTLLLLGPIVTVIYACVGTRSRVLRNSTLISFVVFLLAGGSLLGLAVAVPMVKQKLLWRSASTENAAARPTPGTLELETNCVEPDAVPTFTAIHLVRDGSARWTPAVAEFNGHGPKPQSAQPVIVAGHDPVTHLAVDPQGPVSYGITTHDVGRIAPGTGRFEELPSTPGVSKPSWPSAIAFDAKQGLLLVAARSTGFSYNPRTGAWQELPWLKDDGIVALTYDPQNELLYGLQRENANKVATILLQFNTKGALIARTVLSHPIPVGQYPSPLAQLVLAGDKLITIVYPSSEKPKAIVATGCSLYLIDPRSGDCRTVRSPDVASRPLELETTRASPRARRAEQSR